MWLYKCYNQLIMLPTPVSLNATHNNLVLRSYTLDVLKENKIVEV